MSYLRTILGRFARLLIRIARKLDSSVVAPPDVALSERMAALRLRYAGAPAHWLEAIARRVTIADAPSPAHSPAELEVGDSLSAVPKPRPMPTFPPHPHSARQPIEFMTSANERSAFVRPTRPARPRRGRPQLVFRESRHSPARAEPRAAERRARWDRKLQFHTAPLNREHATQPDTAIPDRRDPPPDHQTAFPCLADRPTPSDSAHRQLEALSPRPSADRTLEFASETGRPDRLGGEWGDASNEAPTRPAPTFTEPLNRWPELPALDQLLQDSDARLLARDEAAIVAEQTVGTWSE